MSRIIDVAGTKLSIPEGYLPMQPMPDDPPGSLPLGMEGPSAMCFLMVFPIPHEQAMPYDDPDEVIEGIPLLPRARPGARRGQHPRDRQGKTGHLQRGQDRRAARGHPVRAHAQPRVPGARPLHPGLLR